MRQLLHHTSGIRDLYDDAGIDEVLARCARPTNADLVKIYAELGCPMAGRASSRATHSATATPATTCSGRSSNASRASRITISSRPACSARSAWATHSRLPDVRASGRRRATGYDIGESEQLVANTGSEFDALGGSGSFCTTVPDLTRYDQALRSYG